MLVRIEGDDNRSAGDWVLEVEPGAALADLLRAVGAPVGPRLVDGRHHEPRTPLAATGIGTGSVIGPPGPPTSDPSRLPRPGIALEAVAGPDTGRRIALPVGSCTIGRGTGPFSLADPALSRRHVLVEVPASFDATGAITVDDLGSTNGTRVGGHRIDAPTVLSGATPLHVGTSELHLMTVAPTSGALWANDAIGATATHHRPPRTPARAAEPPLTPPATPGEADRPRLGLATLAVPLATGAALAALYGPQLAIIAVIGPVIALGGWLAARAKSDRAGRLAHRAHAQALDQLRADAIAAALGEQRRRHEAAPSLAELLDRVRRRDPRLWERRPEHDDFLRLGVGPGDVAWRAPTAGHPDAAATRVLDEIGILRNVPVTVDATALVGITGPRPLAVAVARALAVQATTLHGPADLRLAVLCSASTAADWEWARWLPHVVDPDDRMHRSVTGDVTAAADLVACYASGARTDGREAPADGYPRQAMWWIIDGDDGDLARIGAVRSLLTSRTATTAGVVVADRSDRLPAGCRTIVEVGSRGDVRVRVLDDGATDAHVGLVGIGIATAEAVARYLARLDDPECRGVDGRLPDRCSLLPLLDLGDVSGTAIEKRWQATRGTDEIVIPIGIDQHGPVALDLVRDGPHALVAGTTGSGKSELLRSLVAAIAASSDTDHCTLVLVDFKGGAAFDRLTALPHVVGSVTDLDERLAARALRCLEAELRRREQVLRDVGAADVAAYIRARRTAPDLEPLPRLVVIVDEFATLVADLPEFVDSLVDMAQRGRSLGVHLVLATQRPAGAVKDSIRTNTNLRIALRVVEAADSRDVLGSDVAVWLPRNRPGRAVMRTGSSEPSTFQAAHISGNTSTARRPPVTAARWRPYSASPDGSAAARADIGRTESDQPGESDLARLVDAVIDAHRARGATPVRRPWPEPLPSLVTLDDIDDIGGLDGLVPRGSGGSITGAFGLIDEPDRQRLATLRWEPASGNLLVAGLAGSGVTTALGTVAHALAGAHDPAALHLHVLTTDPTALGPLAQLPHCGMVAAADDLERAVRLLRRLDDELRHRRRAAAGRANAIVTVIDGVGTLQRELDDAGLVDELDLLERLAADGPAVGLSFAFGTDHPGAVGHRLERTVSQRVLLRLGDRTDYVQLGLHGVDPATLPSGRGFLACGSEVQIARWDAAPSFGRPAKLRAPRRRPVTIGGARPWSIERLPPDIPVVEIGAHLQIGEAITLPIGVGDRTLEPVSVTLRPGDHFLIAGPSRSGKSTALDAIDAIARADGRVDVVRVEGRPRRGPVASPSEIAAIVDDVIDGDRPSFVLVDDADLLDDGGALLALVQSGRPGVHVFAAGRADRLRGLFRHWTTELRRCRLGILLRGDELDADLLGARVPRRSPTPWHPGRGWLVTDDGVELCQVGRASVPTEREGDQCA